MLYFTTLYLSSNKENSRNKYNKIHSHNTWVQRKFQRSQKKIISLFLKNLWLKHVYSNEKWSINRLLDSIQSHSGQKLSKCFKKLVADKIYGDSIKFSEVVAWEWVNAMWINLRVIKGNIIIIKSKL